LQTVICPDFRVSLYCFDEKSCRISGFGHLPPTGKEYADLSCCGIIQKVESGLQTVATILNSDLCYPGGVNLLEGCSHLASPEWSPLIRLGSLAAHNLKEYCMKLNFASYQCCFFKTLRKSLSRRISHLYSTELLKTCDVYFRFGPHRRYWDESLCSDPCETILCRWYSCNSLAGLLSRCCLGILLLFCHSACYSKIVSRCCCFCS